MPKVASNDAVNQAVTMVRRGLPQLTYSLHASRIFIVPDKHSYRSRHRPLFLCVSQAANGMSAREAWEHCGKPNGEPGIQNIRKRARLLVAERSGDATDAAPDAMASPPAQEAAPGSGRQSTRKKETFRLRSDQVLKQIAQAEKDREVFDRLFIDATNEWADIVKNGGPKRGDGGAAAVAARYAAHLPEDCKRRLTARSLYNAVSEGRFGVAPLKPGPQRVVPASIVKGAAEFCQLQQIAGNEQKPRQVIRTVVAAVKGTVYESSLATASQRASFLRRVRLENGLATTASVTTDNRRWMWLTSTNLTTWFQGYIAILAEFKFIPGIPDDKFEVIVISAKKLSRMLNGDESHQKLSNEGEQRGPRSHAYVNLALGRAGKRKVEYQKHATILVWVNYAGEVGAPHLMLATDSQGAKKGATDEQAEGIRMNPEWSFGVPRVIGKFGHPTPHTYEPSFIVNEKGGVAGGGLEQFVNQQILPAYPNTASEWQFDSNGEVEAGPLFFQLDAGPDRYTDCSIQWRAKMWAQGLILFPGLPNGTAGNQVLDDLFGTYKTGCAQAMDDLVAERVEASHLDPSAKISIDFCDLGRVINGRPEDPVEARPFLRSFTPEKIVASTRRLGLSPVDLRTALAHPRVRDDSVEGTRTTGHDELRLSSQSTLTELNALGVNSTLLTVHAPSAPPPCFVAPPSDLEERWKAVKAAGGSAGAHWAAVGPTAFNAPEVVGPALERIEDKAAEKDHRQQLKADNFAALREAAQEIIDRMDEEALEYCELTVADLKVLVSYHFQSRSATGASAHSTNKASLLQFLEGKPVEELRELVECAPDTSPVAPVQAVLVTADDPPAPLLALQHAGDRHDFGDTGAQLPGGLDLMPKPPDFLGACLEPGSETASDLVGSFILYRWPPRMGGWLVGKITKVNTDKRQKAGDTVANFAVFYEADQEEAYHSLALQKYAKDANSHTDAWVLLGSA